MEVEQTIQESNVFSLETRRRAALLYPQRLSLLPAGAGFQIQILDDSMKGESIESGDVIDCERVETVDNGSLGVVMTPYGLTVRRYTRTHSYVRLDAAHAAFPALCLSTDEAQIVGRPVRLERWFTSFEESEGAA